MPESVRSSSAGDDLDDDDKPEDDPKSSFDRLVAKGPHSNVGAEATADDREYVQHKLRNTTAPVYGLELVVAVIGEGGDIDA